MKDKIELRIKEIINSYVKDANKDTALYEHGLDSIKVIQLLTQLETEFAIVFTNSDINVNNFKSISTITNLVKLKLDNAE